MWTEFMDMHSGGGQKLDWAYIFVEAPEDEARRVFAARFGRNPDNVTCDCCGSDYSVSEHDTLEQATAYNRQLRSVKGTFDHEKREWTYPGGKCYLEPNDPVPEGAPVEPRYGRVGNGQELADYLANGGGDGILGGAVKVIYAEDITDAERKHPKGTRREKVWAEVDDDA